LKSLYVWGSILTNYWLCVTNEENWNIIKEKHIWGLPEKSGKRFISDIKPGDFLIFYVAPKKVGGIFKVISEPFESREKTFISSRVKKDEIFPYRVKIEPVVVPKELLPFEEVAKKLSFLSGVRYWSVRLRRAMIKIPPEDFETLFKFISP